MMAGSAVPRIMASRAERKASRLRATMTIQKRAGLLFLGGASSPGAGTGTGTGSLVPVVVVDAIVGSTATPGEGFSDSIMSVVFLSVSATMERAGMAVEASARKDSEIWPRAGGREGRKVARTAGCPSAVCTNMHSPYY